MSHFACRAFVSLFDTVHVTVSAVLGWCSNGAGVSDQEELKMVWQAVSLLIILLVFAAVCYYYFGV